MPADGRWDLTRRVKGQCSHMTGKETCTEADGAMLPSCICEKLGSNLYRDYFYTSEVSLDFSRSLQANAGRIPPGRQLPLSSLFTKLVILVIISKIWH